MKTICLFFILFGVVAASCDCQDRFLSCQTKYNPCLCSISLKACSYTNNQNCDINYANKMISYKCGIDADKLSCNIIVSQFAKFITYVSMLTFLQIVTVAVFITLMATIMFPLLLTILFMKLIPIVTIIGIIVFIILNW